MTFDYVYMCICVRACACDCGRLWRPEVLGSLGWDLQFVESPSWIQRPKFKFLARTVYTLSPRAITLATSQIF